MPLVACSTLRQAVANDIPDLLAHLEPLMPHDQG
jgi:hypothetical protein